MTFGELLKQFMDWLYAFWPLRVVHDWEQGVRCLFGNARDRLTNTNGLLGTGVHVFWPAFGEIIVYETNIEVMETELQTHTTMDGVPVTFSLGLKYRINDLKRLYLSIHDARETLSNEISSVAGSCSARMDYLAVRDRLCDQVLLEIKEQMRDWGIEVISLSPINLSEAQPLRLITNTRSPLREPAGA